MTCLMSSIRQQLEQSQQLQLVTAASRTVHSAPDNSTIAVSKSKRGRDNSKRKQLRAKERYQKRLRVHALGAATSSECLEPEQDDGGQQHDDLENQPPPLQQPCVPSAQGRAFTATSEQEQAPSEQPAVEASACQDGNRPASEARACQDSSRLPASASLAHWDVTYQIDPYWAAKFPDPLQKWKLVVPGHPGPHGTKEPRTSWAPKYANLGGKMCRILFWYARFAHTCFFSCVRAT
jgi:hypothetical protein